MAALVTAVVLVNVVITHHDPAFSQQEQHLKGLFQRVSWTLAVQIPKVVQGFLL